MRWNKEARSQQQFRIIGIAVVASLCFLVAHSAEDKQLTIVTPQSSFSVLVQEREGKAYIDLQNVLDQLGNTSSTVEGGTFKLHYDRLEASFQSGQASGKIGRISVQLTGKFLLENQRGLVPLASLVDLLSHFTGGHVEYHEISQRIFVNGGGTRFSAELKKGTPSTLALSFTAPVNPRISSEGGKLRLSFSHDTLVMTAQNQKYDDPLITALHYSENESGGEMVIEASEPLLASFSDKGKTIVLSAAPKLATPASPGETQTTSGTSPASNTPAPENNAGTPVAASAGSAALGEPSVPHARYLIVIDPSHGGSERGAALSDKLTEKDITLAIARRLRSELNDRGLATFMIRDSDATISLDQRAIVTNTSRAAVYVAIHAGTLGRGVRVYTSMLPETAPAPGTFLPWETAQSSYVHNSRILASSVIDQISKNQSKLTVAMMPAPVRPLNNIAGAAIAIEVAPQNGDVESLTSSSYQQMVANSLAAAIVSVRSTLEPSR